MADTKATALTTATILEPADVIVGVDVSDTSMSSTGTTKRFSPAVLQAGLPAFGASGASHAAGNVPDPGASAGTTRFLREDATWVAPSGGSIFVGSGIGHAPGLVPDAGSTPGTSRFLCENATWVAPSGGSVFVGSGTGHAIGLVPDPGNTPGTARYLREDATWFAPPTGSGGTPGGSTGQIQYNSAGSFGGAADWSIGAAGQITSTLISDPSPSAGDMWVSTSQKTLSSVSAGCTIRHGGIIWVSTGPGTALTNSSTETSLLTGISGVGSLTIPANSLVPGKIIRLNWFAAFNVSAAGLLTINTYLGATKVLAGAMVTAVAVNTGATLFNLQSLILVQSIGATGKMIGVSSATATTSTLAGLLSLYQTSGGTTVAQVTVDTTAALTLDLKGKWNEVSASDSITIMGASLFIDG